MPSTLSSAADLRPWRERMGWTQAFAAAELRIHPGSLKRIEGGRAEASGTLLRLAELLEERRGTPASAPAPETAVTEPPQAAAAPRPVPAPRSAFGSPFGRPRSPPKPAAAPQASAPTPVPEPAPSAADLALADALDVFCVPASGRDLVLAEIQRQRTAHLGSRIEFGTSDRQLAEEAEDRESAWRSVTGDARPLALLAALVAETACVG